MSHPTVLIADDHPVVTQGLVSLLEDEFEIVGIVGDGRALIDAAKARRPDAIVADISMPVLSGLDALRRLTADGLCLKFIFLTMHADAELAGEAFRAGASGYLLKQSAGDELITAIHEVMQERVYLTPRIAKDVLTTMALPAARPVDGLTPRQRDVLRLIADGRTMKEVAAALNLSRRTVETHKYEMMHSLGIATTAELIRYAVQHGIVGATS
jgi:DNA-binding NarL/FixJ family response regulator